MWIITKGKKVIREYPTRDQCISEAYSMGWLKESLSTSDDGDIVILTNGMVIKDEDSH